jgi:hypothetical protein
MTQERDVTRMRFAICTSDELHGDVSGEVTAAFGRLFPCETSRLQHTCTPDEITAAFGGAPGTEPGCVDVMLAVRPVCGSRQGYIRKELISWLRRAPPGVWRLLVVHGDVDATSLQSLVRRTQGSDILACFTDEHSEGEASCVLIVRLLAYVRRP